MNALIHPKLLAIAAIGIMVLSNGVWAKDIRQIQLERSGGYMSGDAKMVENPKNIPCNSVKDCREKGQDLNEVSQFEGMDYDASQYPGSCRSLTAGGVYRFNSSAC